jgi:hypothetical protein
MLRVASDLADRPRLFGLRVEIVIALIVASEEFASRGYDAIITSAIEGRHMFGSKHYAGSAVDFRLTHVPPTQWEDLRRNIALRLGPDYDVLLEYNPNHLHIEWDPKQPY